MKLLDVPSDQEVRLEDLECAFPELRQEALVDWLMTDQQEFKVRAFFGPREELPDGEPDWEMRAHWVDADAAAWGQERTMKGVELPYQRAPYHAGRSARHFPSERFSCGEFGIFPYSLLGAWGGENSPRELWSRALYRGHYDGVFEGLHRVSWVRAKDENGSVDRVIRVWVEPPTFRIARIDEFGVGHFAGSASRAIVALSWKFTYLEGGRSGSDAFEFEGAAHDEVHRK
jgi:hypothetical protein